VETPHMQARQHPGFAGRVWLEKKQAAPQAASYHVHSSNDAGSMRALRNGRLQRAARESSEGQGWLMPRGLQGGRRNACRTGIRHRMPGDSRQECLLTLLAAASVTESSKFSVSDA
jgi:hypothetical protein